MKMKGRGWIVTAKAASTQALSYRTKTIEALIYKKYGYWSFWIFEFLKLSDCFEN